MDKTSYEEINNFLEASEIDAAFVCSGPYVDGLAEFGLQPLVAPQAYGETVYYSYIIVHIDSPATSFADLKGKTFAFADPQSNTGCLVPNYILARLDEVPDTFFDTLVKSQNLRWLSKNRQMQGAQISRNEAYLSTSQ